MGDRERQNEFRPLSFPALSFLHSCVGSQGAAGEARAAVGACLPALDGRNRVSNEPGCRRRRRLHLSCRQPHPPPPVVSRIDLSAGQNLKAACQLQEERVTACLPACSASPQSLGRRFCSLFNGALKYLRRTRVSQLFSQHPGRRRRRG